MESPPTTEKPDVTSSSWSFSASTNTTTATRPSFSLEDFFVAVLRTYPDYRNSEALGLYGCSAQVAVGTVTNLLTVAVMTRKALFLSTTCVYFTFLAAADLCVLYFGCLRRLLTLVNDLTDVYLRSTGLCRVMNFLAYCSYDMSSWILTVMTIDRFIAIRYPLKSATICTRRNACLTLSGIAILCAAKNFHFFLSFEHTDKDGCLGGDDFIDFLDKVWPWIDAAFYSFLPFSLLLLFNILIIRCHRKALKQQRSLHATTSLSAASPRCRLSRFNLRLTAMLLVVSFTFMVMTAPKVILLCIRREAFKFSTPEGRINFVEIARYSLVSAVFNFLMWTNHSINFFLYCLSGTRFRQEFLRMLSHWTLRLRCKRRSRVSASNICGGQGQGQAARSKVGAEGQRRGSSTSVLSDDVAPAPPLRLPSETEDVQSRVTHWARVNFGEMSSTK
ncbi:hypothetical protein ACOMHN_048710 [Nucella lapillus]